MPHKNAHKGSVGFRERLWYAWFRYKATKGRDVPQRELGSLVAKRLGLKRPLRQASVSRWFIRTEPDLDTIAAIADVLGVPRGWLAFGDGPTPEDGSTPIPMPRQQPPPSPRGKGDE